MPMDAIGKLTTGARYELAQGCLSRFKESFVPEHLLPKLMRWFFHSEEEAAQFIEMRSQDAITFSPGLQTVEEIVGRMLHDVDSRRTGMGQVGWLAGYLAMSLLREFAEAGNK